MKKATVILPAALLAAALIAACASAPATPGEAGPTPAAPRTDDDCIKFLKEIMINNARRKNLKTWWEMNPDSENDPQEIKISLKDYFGL